MGGGAEEYGLETNSFSGSGFLGDLPPPSTTPPCCQHTSVARVPVSDSSVSPLHPRSSRAAAGDDFLSIIEIQMMQGMEEKKKIGG